MISVDCEKCFICGHPLSGGKYPYVNESYNGSLGELFKDLSIYVCQKCGFGFAFPLPSPKRLEEFYEQAYRSVNGSHAHQVREPSSFSKYGLRGMSQLQLGRIFIQHPEKKLKILDIGSGPGDALLAAKAVFSHSELFAIEPDQYSHPFLKKLGVHVYDFAINADRFSQMKQKFDIILCSHLIEHFNAQELIDIIRGLKNILENEGIIILEVPYVDIAKYRDKRGSDAPHLSFFSLQSLEKLLEKEFKVLFCRCCGPLYLDSYETMLKMKRVREDRKDVNQRGFLIKKGIRIPFIHKFLALKNKLSGENLYQIIGSDLFAYGEERLCIRAVVTLKEKERQA